MANTIFGGKRIILTVSMAVVLVGFGASVGVASADPENCWGGIGSGSDHQPFTVGSAANGGCVAMKDASDGGTGDDVSSWGTGDSVSSYPGHNVAMTASPQTKVP
jgi:hypothetical protein